MRWMSARRSARVPLSELVRKIAHRPAASTAIISSVSNSCQRSLSRLRDGFQLLSATLVLEDSVSSVRHLKVGRLDQSAATLEHLHDLHQLTQFAFAQVVAT